MTSLLAWANSERSPMVVYLVAGGLGALAAFFLFGWDVIAGTGSYWTTTHNDSVQTVASISYYLREGWNWPVLFVESYGYPEGVNLVFTDSIPLLALIAKSLRFAVPDGWHYLGYWLAVCCVLQAVSMVVLLRVLAWRTITAALFGSGFALSQMAFFVRYVHAALLAQFLIIFALAVYVYSHRTDSHGKHLILWSILVLGSLFVHPYLFAMVAVIAATSLLQLVHSRRMPMRLAAVWAIGTSGLVAGSIWLLALGSSATGGDTGFGRYSMNLLAPIIPRIDATGAQWEGSSYLGLGLLSLLVVNVVLSRKMIADVLRRHWVLLGGVILMALYALSNVVYAGNLLLVKFPVAGPVGWLAGQFRSSGRFIWPLVYVVVAGVLIMTFRRFRPGVALLLLGLALIVQGIDIAGMVDNVRTSVRTTEAQLLETDWWGGLIASHDLVHVTPYQCAGTNRLRWANLELQRLAANENTRITAVASARRAADCQDESFDAPLERGELRVVWDPEYQLPDREGSCKRFALGTVCSLQALDLPAAESVHMDASPEAEDR